MITEYKRKGNVIYMDKIDGGVMPIRLYWDENDCHFESIPSQNILTANDLRKIANYIDKMTKRRKVNQK